MNTALKIIFPAIILTMIVIINSKSKANNTMEDYGILELDGTSKYYSEPYSKKLLTGKAITIESWFKSDNNSGTVIERSSKGTYTYRLFIIDNILKFTVNTGKDYSVETTLNGSSDWNHVTAIYNSKTGRLKLYLNGVLAAQEINKPAEILDFGSDSLFIGRSGEYFTGNTYFKGHISDVRIWNSSERTPLQIISHMPRERDYDLNPDEVVTFDFVSNKTSGQNALDAMTEDEHLSQYFSKEEPWKSLINDQSKTISTTNK